MELSDERRIAAPRERVWAALNDPEVLRRCIPGCQSLDKRSETEMDATVALKVGPVKATFQGSVTLQDLNPPESYVIVGEGKGGAAGFAKGRAEVTLLPEEGATLLCYAVRADVGGKIAQLGSRLMEGTARKLSGEFFEKFGAIVEEGEVPAAEAPEPEAATPAPEPPASPASIPAPTRAGIPAWLPWLLGAAVLVALAALLMQG